MSLIKITTGAICESWGCVENLGWIPITVFLFVMWWITLMLFIKERRKNMRRENEIITKTYLNQHTIIV